MHYKIGKSDATALHHWLPLWQTFLIAIRWLRHHRTPGENDSDKDYSDINFQFIAMDDQDLIAKLAALISHEQHLWSLALLAGGVLAILLGLSYRRGAILVYRHSRS